jgi:antitoxin ParD1/3/4
MGIENIPDELRAFVRAELGSGRYRSLDDLLAEGLRALHERETFIGDRCAELRDEIARGVAQVERGEFIDGEAAMERLRSDLADPLAEK